MYKSEESPFIVSAGQWHYDYNPCEILEYSLAFVLFFQVFHIDLRAPHSIGFLQM